MTSDQRSAFGMSEQAEEELTALIFQHLGIILSANGYGASGVFVEMRDGRTGLLTARHNLLPCILSGELTVGYMSGGVACTVEPIALRIARRCDAALVYMPEGLNLSRLTLSEWDPANFIAPKKGQGVIAVGTPGEWASEPNLEARTIDWKIVLLFWTAVLDPDWHGAILLDVDESDANLPDSFGGISGGPVFDPHGCLVGINKAEHRGNDDGYIYVTSRASWAELRRPVAPPSNPPDDLMRQEAMIGIDVVHEAWPQDAPPVKFFFVADYYWSAANPASSVSSFAHVYRAVICGSDSGRYPMNVDFYMPLPQGHTDVTRYAALRDSVVAFLADMKLYPKQP